MSDATPVPVSTAVTHAVSFEHELFWAEIRTLFAEALQNAQPRMGTVLEANGERLNVLPDGSAVFKALPHLAGRRYAPGDRVILAPVQGKPIIIGGVLSAVGVPEAVIGTADIAFGAITADQLADGAVTEKKIADGAVTFRKIPPGTIQGSGTVSEADAHLAALTVRTRELQNDAVTREKIKDLAVNEGKIANNSITHEKMADGAVGAKEIAAGAVDHTHIAFNEIFWNQLSVGVQGFILDICNHAPGAVCTAPTT